MRQVRGKCFAKLRPSSDEQQEAEELDPDTISPLARLSMGEAAPLYDREDTITRANIISVYKRTVDQAKAHSDKLAQATRDQNLKKHDLIKKLLEADPGSYIAAMLKKELSRGKQKRWVSNQL